MADHSLHPLDTTLCAISPKAPASRTPSIASTDSGDSSPASSLKGLPRPLSIRHSQSYDSPSSSPIRRRESESSVVSSPSPFKNVRPVASFQALTSIPTTIPPPAAAAAASSSPPSSPSPSSSATPSGTPSPGASGGPTRSQSSPPLTKHPKSRASLLSNPLKKIQTTFGNAKRSLDLSISRNNNHANNNANPANNSSINLVSNSLVVNGHGTNSTGNSNSTTTGRKALSGSSSASSLTSWKNKGAELFSRPTWARLRKNSEPLLNNLISASSSSPPLAGSRGASRPGHVFGTDLGAAIRLSQIPDAPHVPAVLYRCAIFLEDQGVHEEGIYRIPGNHTEVQKLKRIFDTGKDYDLLARKDDIHPWDIATLLKLYLRELPERLMPDRMLEEIQALQTTDRQICHKLRRILIQLPAANYGVLSFLFHHLSKIAAHEETTKMTVWNMGTVFAPTLGIGQVLFTALMGGYHDVNGGNTSGSESASSSRSRSPSLSQNSSCASIQGSTGAAAAAAATVPVAVTIGDECISGEGRHNDDENLLLISRRSVAANATAIRSATMTAAEAAGYREKGMKIVWGGLMQDESVDYLLQDWTDPDGSGIRLREGLVEDSAQRHDAEEGAAGVMDERLQRQRSLRHQQSMPAMSVLNNQRPLQLQLGQLTGPDFKSMMNGGYVPPVPSGAITPISVVGGSFACSSPMDYFNLQQPLDRIHLQPLGGGMGGRQSTFLMESRMRKAGGKGSGRRDSHSSGHHPESLDTLEESLPPGKQSISDVELRVAFQTLGTDELKAATPGKQEFDEEDEEDEEDEHDHESQQAELEKMRRIMEQEQESMDRDDTSKLTTQRVQAPRNPLTTPPEQPNSAGSSRPPSHLTATAELNGEITATTTTVPVTTNDGPETTAVSANENNRDAPVTTSGSLTLTTTVPVGEAISVNTAMTTTSPTTQSPLSAKMTSPTSPMPLISIPSSSSSSPPSSSTPSSAPEPLFSAAADVGGLLIGGMKAGAILGKELPVGIHALDGHPNSSNRNNNSNNNNGSTLVTPVSAA